VTGADGRFARMMLASLAVHALVVALLAVAPGGGGRISQVQVYTVQIIEGPAPPEARALALEPPEGRLALPATPVPPPPRLTAPVLSGGSAPLRAPALSAPEAPRGKGDTSVTLKAPGAPAQATDLPALPGSAAPPGVRARPASPTAPAPPELAAPGSSRPMEQLRKKVEQIHLEVETPAAKGQPGQEESGSLLDLRLFHNAVRERVQQNYKFPGTFPATLHARVRVVVGRDGTKRSVDLIESSGDTRFDTLVCLAAIRNSRLPRVPEALQGDTVTLLLTCSP
jgi:hypothetical protein